MSAPLIIVHIIVSIIMILIVLLQVGRGAEAGAMFGGSGQAQVLRGSDSFVSKFTTGLAITFMLTSLLLTYYTSDKAKSSVIDNVSQEQTEQAVPTEDALTEKTEPIVPESTLPIKDVSPTQTKSLAPEAKDKDAAKKPPISAKVENKSLSSSTPKPVDKNLK